MTSMWHKLACLLVAATIGGCAATTQGVDDLSGSGDDLGVDDLGPGEDMSLPPDLTPPDLMVVCDVDAGFRLCVDKCVGPTQCCQASECPTVTNGQPVCTNGTCGFSCDVMFKGCGSKCIPTSGCCLAAECISPPDPCQTNIGATCVNNACVFPPLSCPYTGQTCTAGTCACPSGQKVCQNAGKCIPNATCCTSADCAAIVGQVCPMAGGTCSCLAGNKTCLASNSCIAQASCCTVADCLFAGQSCSGAGGVCSCPANQRPCSANNACIANTQCCTTVPDCTGGQVCPSPGGSCGCPINTYFCAGTSSCIPSNKCCTDSNCPPGQVCSGFGGTCACAAGTRFCSTSNTCIPSASCCNTSECTGVTGYVCSMPGGSCGCPGGQKVCGTACIPNSQCCTAADCPLTSQVAVTFCQGAAGCGIFTCNPGWANPNLFYSDGCECADSPYAKSCGGASALGTIGVGATPITRSGALPLANEENWFLVTFQYTTATSYHPQISLAGGGFVFDVYTDCSFTPLGCATEGGSSVDRTSWEVTGGGNSTGLTYAPTPSVGTVYIRVRRGSGALSCSSYTLTVSN